MIKKRYYFKNGTEQVIPMDKTQTLEEMEAVAKKEMIDATEPGAVLFVGIKGEFFQTFRGDMLQSITLTKFK